jgi:hypothetical protein
LSSGTYELRVDKAGFYLLVQSDVQVGVTANVDVTLRHQQEAREVVNVVESAPAIDPAQISTKEELTGAEIVDYSTIYNAEASAFAEDRWLITNRLLIEPGLRFDWDEIVRAPLFSPRLAGTYILDDEGNTKLSAGIGVIYDTTSLGLIHQPLEGQRVDYFFDPDGNPTDANGRSASDPVPVPTTFTVNRDTLAAPVPELEYRARKEAAGCCLSESGVP